MLIAMIWHAGIPDNTWDKTLFVASGHFTQSSHWAAVQSALGNQVFYAQGDGWQCLAVVEQGQLGKRLYCPYGPTVASLPAFDVCISALKQLAKQQGAAYIRIEPQGKLQVKQLQARGFRSAPKDAQPKYTWVKDIGKSTDEIISEMTSTNRNLHNTATKKGLVFKQSRSIGDLPTFLDMMHEVAKFTGIKPHTDGEFQAIASTLLPRNAASLYFALHGKKVVAGAFIYNSPTTGYYAHAASYHAARKLQAASPLLTHIILEAKKQGQKQFDFFGIAPPDQPNHRWAGFSTFKKSFGGEPKQYIGTWELPTKPLRYVAYRIAHKAKQILP